MSPMTAAGGSGPAATAPRELGRPEYAAVNRVLAERLARRRPLVLAHRGTAIGSVAENTLAAARASIASGADMVEIDVSASTDGRFYAFHDGTEQENLGIVTNLCTLDAARIEELRYVRVDRRERPARVEPLLELLGALRDHRGPDGEEALVNVDRSWPWWPTLLPLLDRLGMTGRLLLKCPATATAALDVLRAQPVKHPFVPICTEPEQVEDLIEDRDLNLVGVELLAGAEDHPFVDAGYIASLHARGLLVLANAEVLTNDRPLFAGYDDERALAEGPEAGWGPLIDLGVDVVQTDWPWLLHAYRERRDGDASARRPAEPDDAGDQA